MSAANQLAEEASPYLRQHKDNPVWWQSWGAAAFNRAKREKKPIFLSIGYSTCYWCHVMEEDSFAHDDVADILNRSFVSIKVDREERPDVDKLYMDVLIRLTGRGGWPMSVFLTPDLKPFWAGTFLYRGQFVRLLHALAVAWETDAKSVADSAANIHSAIVELEGADAPVRAGTGEVTQSAYEMFSRSYDEMNGGFGEAPKFPPAMQLQFLMAIHPGLPRTNEIVRGTLDHMACGGIFDHVGGGFHRYATDAAWRVPHFEKMLYDNALLASAYLDAYVMTGAGEYEVIARRTLDYMKHRLLADGAFMAAEDAGEAEREGEYYSWTCDDLRSSLPGETFSMLERIYDVAPRGNLESGRMILCARPGTPLGAACSEDCLKALSALAAAREKRPRPHSDDKIVTAWNGLAISAFVEAYQFLGDKVYITIASEAALFLLRRLLCEGVLQRHICRGRAGGRACLEDYALFIGALLALYEATSEEHWLRQAMQLQSVQDKLFWDDSTGGYYVSDAPELILRQKEFHDGALPSGNSVAWWNLSKFKLLFPATDYEKKERRLAEAFGPYLRHYAVGAPRALRAAVFNRDPALFAVIAGADGRKEELLRALRKRFRNTGLIVWNHENENFPPVIAGKKTMNGRSCIYACRGSSCLPPVTDVSELSL